jgi:Mce-associated membrane protein
MTAVVERTPLPETSDPTPRRHRPTARLALGLAVVAALVLAIVLGQRALAERARAQDKADVVSAARQMGVNFSTLSYQSFDRDTARVIAGSTGAFRSDFTAQAAQIKKVVVANRSESTGQVGPVAIVTWTGTKARTLVVLDASVTNTSSAKPAARHYRMQLDLQKVNGRWLVSQLQFVG